MDYTELKENSHYFTLTTIKSSSAIQPFLTEAFLTLEEMLLAESPIQHDLYN